jgi:hypothetical protein
VLLFSLIVFVDLFMPFFQEDNNMLWYGYADYL